MNLGLEMVSTISRFNSDTISHLEWSLSVESGVIPEHQWVSLLKNICDVLHGKYSEEQNGRDKLYL